MSKNKCMSVEEMNSRLKAGYAPIDVAIEKWDGPAAILLKMNGYEHGSTCALCCVIPGHGCGGCPLYEIGYCCNDDGSPFKRALKLKDKTIMQRALRKAKKWVEEQKCKEMGKPKPKEKRYHPAAGDKVTIEIRKGDAYFGSPEQAYLEEHTFIVAPSRILENRDGTYGCEASKINTMERTGLNSYPQLLTTSVLSTLYTRDRDSKTDSR